MARPGLRNHPKFRRLVATLGEPRPHVIGYLDSMWEVCYENGNPLLGDGIDVILAAEYPHQDRAGAFVQALETCGGQGRAGFIERNDDGLYEVHDLYDHAPDYVQRRMERETHRTLRGTTISEMRREAGRKGGLARAAKIEEAKAKQTPPFAIGHVANGATPAPAPAPAPAHQPTKPSLAVATGHATSEGLAGWLDVSFSWEQASGRLAAMGAARWKEAIEDAKRCGCTPALANAIMDYGQSLGYHAGAVVYRLQRANPSLAITEAWPLLSPKVDPGEQAQKNRAAQTLAALRDAEASAIIRQMRKAGCTDDSKIHEALKAKGLEWTE